MIKAINKFCPNPKNAAEIGVYKGETSKALHLEYPHLHLIMVDPWKAWDIGDSYHGDKEMGRQSQEVWDEIYLQALRNSFSGPTIIHRCLSHEAAEFVEDNSLDFVYLDANHHYEEVKRDLEVWEKKCKTLIMGHDYGSLMDKRGFWGVKKAVDERYSGKVKIHKYKGFVWAVDLRAYRRSL